MTAATKAVTAPVDGLRDASPRVHALVGGRIVIAPGKVIESGTVVVRDGVIEAVGANVALPADARVWNVAGRTLYAGFLESQSELFLPAGLKTPPPPEPEEPSGAPKPPRPAPEPAAGAHAWNALVTPERDIADKLAADPKGVEALRKLGFTTAHIVPARGVFRGQTALVSLGDGNFSANLVRRGVAQAAAFAHGDWPDVQYPSSLMGSIALIRQTLSDGLWYDAAQTAYAKQAAGAEQPETNAALAALAPVVTGREPLLVSAADELQPLRAQKIADEFKLKLVIRGSGYEYRVVGSLDPHVPVITPLDFPETPVVETAALARDVSLDELEHWELAPANAGRLAAAGVPVALTSAGLKKPAAEFWPRVRRSVKAGLTADAALAALTTIPAGILGVSDTRGTVEAGKVADLVVVAGDPFTSDDAEIQLVLVKGMPFQLEGWRRRDVRGTWQASWQGAPGPAELQIAGTLAKPKASVADKDGTLVVSGEELVLLAPGAWFGLAAGMVRLTARTTGDAIAGTGELPDGGGFRWAARRTGPPAPDKKKDKEPEKTPDAPRVAKGDTYPAGVFGRTAAPAQPAAVFVRNATIWTCGPQGIIEGGDLLVENGRITRIGRGLTAPAGAVIIDATGKSVSPGIIDPHSHIAIADGVNEAGQSVTCEVRIGDVLDPTDISIYRQLAGGTTTANLLHGSANAMGGQCQVIKLRWGAMPEELKFAGAMPSVKFALGENVKQSNWGERHTTRYPQTRMGVREIMDDTFTRARDYERAWAEFRAGRVAAPRRDLELDAVLEILQGERLINIHSYRQDEVLMFIRLAQKWKLPAIVFQHILEGYKVAGEIAALGASASCFSDWWAYKMEVLDAIPYDGALMRAAGVLVSFNSDDAELGRRLNTEAAKAVKYGGVPPEEALKFATINPARQLRIADRVGSLEPGKDADFVIWSGSPLSTFSRAEQTWIDGRCYFSIEEDARLRATAKAERAALIQKILPERLKALGGGGPPGGGEGPPTSLYADGRHGETCTSEGGHRQ
ncbi:MAG TPA: amidohydrolase family protein [Lacunisphaera sp.]|nr:amidohydrolase family protein [Lacunisphaera sp.]